MMIIEAIREVAFCNKKGQNIEFKSNRIFINNISQYISY